MDIIAKYLQLGFTHVVPLGYDHLLFIISLCLLNSKPKSIIVQCSLFTLAHSITLGLCAAGFIIPNSSIIEPLIALSILYTAVENIVHERLSPWRLLIIFGFGLIHGMGFAGALQEVGIPKDHFFIALISFNLGVELAQLMIVLLCYFLLLKWISEKSWYRSRVVYPISSIIACIALYWTVERVMLIK
jgi:HupE / UreJ protein